MEDRDVWVNLRSLAREQYETLADRHTDELKLHFRSIFNFNPSAHIVSKLENLKEKYRNNREYSYETNPSEYISAYIAEICEVLEQEMAFWRDQENDWKRLLNRTRYEKNQANALYERVLELSVDFDEEEGE